MAKAATSAQTLTDHDIKALYNKRMKYDEEDQIWICRAFFGDLHPMKDEAMRRAVQLHNGANKSK